MPKFATLMNVLLGYGGKALGRSGARYRVTLRLEAIGCLARWVGCSVMATLGQGGGGVGQGRWRSRREHQ